MKRSILVLAAFVIAFTFVEGRNITISPGPGILQLSINNALPHDTIFVKAGSYPESDIEISKPITLIGLDMPVVDGGRKAEIFRILSDSVTIRGFLLQNVGYSFTQDWAGIRVEESDYATIEGNTLLDAYFGIYLKKATYSTVRNNVIKGKATNEVNSGNGIHLWYCSDVLIESNEITGHRDGIYFEFVENSKIINNNSHGNVRYGLHFMFSNKDDYIGNTFCDNGTGVAVMYSDHINMKNNRFLDNWGTTSYGLLFKDIRDGELSGNKFTNNTVGLFSDGCNRIKIMNNEFRNNGWAMNIFANSMDNEFAHNNFIGNSFDLITNSAQSTNNYHHNYWDQYTGYDLDKDGLGDVPHRPVKLFSYLIGKVPESIILMRSFFIDMLNIAEKVTPIFTPQSLMDEQPFMKQIIYD